MSTTKTSKDYTGNADNQAFAIPFNFYKTDDIKADITDATGAFVTVDNFTVGSLAGSATAYTGGTVNFDSTTGTLNTNVCESDGAPKNARTVRIYRQTVVHTGNNAAVDPAADYNSGSVIRKVDLENNQKQALMAAFEQQDQEIVSKKI